MNKNRSAKSFEDLKALWMSEPIEACGNADCKNTGRTSAPAVCITINNLVVASDAFAQEVKDAIRRATAA